MKIKVLCSCGAKFEFEVEPVNGLMPVAINCPTCGIDATSFANAVIKQQLNPQPVESSAGTTNAAQPRIRVHAAAPAPPPPTVEKSPAVTTSVGRQGLVAPPSPGQGGLKISRPGSNPSAVDAPPPPPPPPATEPAETASEPLAHEEPATEFCHRHKNDPAIEHCVVCGKPICGKCMEQFGYVCSIFCREAAPHHNIRVPEFAGQRGVAEARAARRTGYLAAAVVALALLAVVGWGWYHFFARNPKVVLTSSFAKTDATPFFSLLAPGQLLTLKDTQASLQNLNTRQSLWSVALNSTPSETGFLSSAAPQVVTTSNDVWIATDARLLRLDRQTGARKDLALPENLHQIIAGPTSFLLISGTVPGHARVTQISIADGSSQSEEVAIPGGASTSVKPASTTTAARGRGVAPTSTQRLQNLASRSGQPAEPSEPSDTSVPQPFSPPTPSVSIVPLQNGFYPSSPNAVQFQARLLEQRTVTHETMKKKPGSSVLDSANVTASQGLDLANEMFNESRRQETGGIQIEDVSRYQVTLHRLFSPNSTDWSGEVSGPPQFHNLKTVDLVVAGTNLLAFDKNNKKLWDAKLTFLPRPGEPICLETADALYFADQGILTRFDLLTGNVRWRLTSVGISQIINDDKGNIYISTTTASPDSIRYSQQVDVRSQIQSVIARVDPNRGAIVWSTARDSGDYRVYTSGKFLYSSLQWLTQDYLRLEDGPDNKFNVKLLSPSNGEEIWKHLVPGQILLKAEMRDNWILLQFTDQVSVLKFFSL